MPLAFSLFSPYSLPHLKHVKMENWGSNLRKMVGVVTQPPFQEPLAATGQDDVSEVLGTARGLPESALTARRAQSPHPARRHIFEADCKDNVLY